VQITHQSVVNAFESLRKLPGVTARDTLIAVTTFSFDIAVLELLLPLMVGGRVVIATYEAAMDGVLLAKLLAQSGATIMQATPATWRTLLESGWTGNPNLKVLCGGEAWSAELALQLAGKCASLWNMYGPTETTIWSAVNQIRGGEAVLIGKPIANTQFYVLDPHLQATPIGVPGELCIGGEGLAVGYWRRPELTAEKFIRNPFMNGGDARIYRTGDLVRRHPDGMLEFLGRKDQQVKVRGYRIELGEIEAILGSQPLIRDCVAAVRADACGENRLVAYIVSEALASVTPDELRHCLSGQLPEYMVPSAFVFLEELPRTPNGKVNRGALPPIDLTHSGEDQDRCMRPSGPVEEALAKIWQEVLGRGWVGIKDNFFDLGGHSLMATRVIARIRNVFRVEIPMKTFFEMPTISAISTTIQKALAQDVEGSGATAPIPGLR
jgi:acyl-CoA synthetase (AMP-forming)/AMP-acid ligase II/acyl carrier protein